MKHRYSVWKPKGASRKRLIISNDGGNRYKQIAVFSNEESEDKFDMWISEVLRETRELVEPKHGYWIEEIGMFLCSECGDSWGTEMEEMVRSFNYCPNCGAKMDEVTNET